MQNIFRIFRTILSNVEKHSGATSLIVAFTVDKQHLTLRIIDNGRGLSTSSKQNQPDNTPHFGKLLIRSYAERIGAEVTVKSAPHQDTDVTIVVGW